MKTICLLGVLTCAAVGVRAAALDEGFRDVPVAERPWCYWWWLNGHVDKETITSDLEAMKRVGFGGLLMFDARGYWDDANHLVIPKPDIEFMSPEWRGLLKFGIQEAARVGLEVSVNLSSCAGALKGPWEVGPDAPKRLICKTEPLAGGARFEATLAKPDRKYFWPIATFAVRYEGAPVAAQAEWVNGGDGLYTMQASSGKKIDGQKTLAFRTAQEVVELTDKVSADGRLVWDVPQGQWALVRFGHTTIDGHEYDVDVLDPQAVTAHFRRMGDAIIADVGPLAGKTLTHFYSVSWEGAVPTWTGVFEAEFTKYSGYAIRPWLPVLAGFAIKDEASSKRFISDYRRARNDCFRDNFYVTMMELCHKRGLEWHSESGGPWNRNPNVFGEADQLSFLGRNDMPQGEFWYTGTARRQNMSRPQAITSHIYGKRLAASEAFTHMVRHWSAYPAALKVYGDEAFCDGVNQLVWHTFTCSPKKFGWPGSEYFAGTHINPKVTWFEQAAPFMTYLGRCQHMLRQGRYVADVCAYIGDVPYFHWGRFTTNWSPVASMTLPPGHAYDVFSTEVLLERAAAKDGAVVLPDGMNYRVLAVDLDGDQAPVAALRKVAALKQAGVPVVFGKRTPARTPGQAAGDDEVRKLGETLWRGSGSLVGALKAAGLAPDFEGPFDYTHRRDGGTDIYFVSGAGNADCTFRVSGKRAELWDPVTGKIEAGIGDRKTDDGRTVVTLDLPQNGSVFVVFREGDAQRPTLHAPRSTEKTGEITLAGPWDVTFQPGRGAPEKAVFETLVDWSTHADAGIRYFSGTGTYRIAFDATTEQAARKAVLQLGKVGALAQVRLNGKALGTVWTAPWQTELTGVLKAGRNELEIAVTNPWENRLIGDAGLPPEQRITQSNLQYEKGKRTLKGFQGYASEDKLSPSGLMGPVQLEFF